MAVADGTMDCDSVVVCAAWSHTASGDGMVYASGLYHGGLPVMVGWVASLVIIVDSTTATEHPLVVIADSTTATEVSLNLLIRLSMQVCFVFGAFRFYYFFFFVCVCIK